MDAEFVKWLATLGIGGVLAGFIFIFYRKDIKQYTELWKTTSEQLIEVIRENTASNVRLSFILDSIERDSVKLSDLKEFCRFGSPKIKE